MQMSSVCRWMQTVVLTLLSIIRHVVNELGTPLYHFTKRSEFLESLACTNHEILDQEEAGGEKDQKQAKAGNFTEKKHLSIWCAMYNGRQRLCVVQLCMCNPWPGSDRGSEAVGSGKGVKRALLRDAFAWRGGFLKQMWETREALAQPMQYLFLKNPSDSIGDQK
jgi:hypothetical protein